MIILYKKINIIENYNHLCYKLKVVGRFLELLTRSCRLFRCSLYLSSCVACYCRDLCICLLYDAFFYCLHRSCVRGTDTDIREPRRRQHDTILLTPLATLHPSIPHKQQAGGDTRC